MGVVGCEYCVAVSLVVQIQSIRWFSAILDQVEWPFTTSSPSLQQEGKWDDHMKLFKQLFVSLLQLNLDHALDGEEPRPQTLPTEQPGTPTTGDLLDGPFVPSLHSSSFASNASSSLPLPLELMVAPFRKRFRYHFMEARKTNNLEKVRRGRGSVGRQEVVAYKRVGLMWLAAVFFLFVFCFFGTL